MTQFRLYLKWQPENWITLFLEGQDSRVFGEELTAAPAINENATPNIFADDFDLHQGYLEIKSNSEQLPINVRAGRQKFNLGAQRLVASLEWVNTARVWDGVRVTVGQKKKRTLEAIASRLVPVNPNRFNNHSLTGSRYFNSGFHGIYYTDWLAIPNTQLEGYWLYRHVGNVNDKVHTIGARFETQKDKFDVNGEFAGQVGEFGGLDHRALMIHFGAGTRLQSLNNSHLGIAYNFATGDDDPTDTTHKTFDNLYPLNHAYYGYMDLFSLQNVHNTEIVFKTKIKKLAVRSAHQNFWLVNEDNDAWYNAGLGAIRNAGGQDVNSRVGSELDITVNYPLNKKLVVVGGYSHFFTGKYISQTGTHVDADFAFLMTKLTFF